MPRIFIFSALLLILVAAVSVPLAWNGNARADVGGVSSDVPVFAPDQPVTITVSAEEDDGNLVITSNIAGSEMTVINCNGGGSNQLSGKCDSAGMSAVTGNGTKKVTIDTKVIDSDTTVEPLTVDLTLIVECDTKVVVTVSADQPGNEGPDDVTINCIPPTPTPSPTPTNTPPPTPTNTPQPTATPPPPATSTPPPPPQAPLQSNVLSITPPRTGTGGLK